MAPVNYNNRNAVSRQRFDSKAWSSLFMIVLTFLATFRLVAHNIGGGDALMYVANFQNVLRGGEDRGMGNTGFEPGFMLFTKIIRYLSSDYHVYFAICYGFIVWSYFKFIKSSCPKRLCYIPFILLMYPFLRSFCTMRSSIAIGLFLIGLTLMRKYKWWSLIFIISTLFFHRMSILFVPIWLFYIVAEKKFNNLSRLYFVVFSLGGIFLTFFVATNVQKYVIALDILSKTDSWYLNRNADESLLLKYPMFFGQLLLFIMIVLIYNKIKWKRTSKMLRLFFIYDIWMIPSALILGMWRNIEYLYLVRLSLWSLILYTITKNNKNAIFIKMGAMFAFVSWLYIRIYKEWDQLKISPYILDLF